MTDYIPVLMVFLFGLLLGGGAAWSCAMWTLRQALTGPATCTALLAHLSDAQLEVLSYAMCDLDSTRPRPPPEPEPELRPPPAGLGGYFRVSVPIPTWLDAAQTAYLIDPLSYFDAEQDRFIWRDSSDWTYTALLSARSKYAQLGGESTSA